MEVYAQTVPPTVITSQEVWTKAKSPYVVNKTITIDASGQLIVEPGTVVKFGSNGNIEVYGSVKAIGNSTDSIFFNGDYDIDNEPTSFTLNSPKSFDVEYCNIRDHFYFANARTPSNIKISHCTLDSNNRSFIGNGSLLLLTSCVFTSNKKCVSDMQVFASDIKFIDNVVGLQGTSGYISNSLFQDNGNGGIMNSGMSRIDSNTFIGNGTAVQYQSDSNNLYMRSNLFRNNTTGLQVNGSKGPPLDSIYNNIFCNSYLNIDNETKLNLDLSNNCWCDSDSNNVTALISNKVGGSVKFLPFHSTCRGCKPVLAAIPDTVCSEIPFDLTSTNLTADSTKVFQWSLYGQEISTGNVPAIQKAFLNTSGSFIFQTFWLKVTTPTCKDSAFVNVFVFPRSYPGCGKCVAFAGPDQNICSSVRDTIGTFEMNPFLSYTWFPSNGLDNPFGPRPAFSMENKGTDTIQKKYVLYVSDSLSGCFASDTLQIVILPEHSSSCKGLPDIHVYNVITPNGDEDNQYFTIDNIQYYPRNVVSVYNRWGNRIMHRMNYSNDWDGNNLPDGVYYYIVSIPELSQEYKGDLTIKK